MTRFTWMAVLGGAAWLASGIVVSTAGELRATASQSGIETRTFAPTPVSGPSHLRRLGLTKRQSAMGFTGRWGPAPRSASLVTAATETLADPADPFMLTGANLYRLGCRACHKADGTGSRSEIPSIIDPIRSTSPSIMRQRMQARGTPISAAFAKELASGSREDLLIQLKEGGEKMPTFDHLSGVEVDAVLAYLEMLASVPGAADGHIHITEAATRVGEHVVKSTCHICHDATGPWPGPEALLDGAIPSLASVVRQRNVSAVIQKVRHGAPVIMGRARTAYRGRMPLFNYLTDNEVSAAYTYLLAYPPTTSR